MTLIAVVLNSNGTNVYLDTAALLDYGFNNFKLVNVSENDSRFAQNDTPELKSPFSKSNDLIYIDKASTIVIPKDTDFSKLQSEVNFSPADDSFATITYKFGDTSVGTAQLIYESNVSDNKNTDEEVSTTEKSTDNNNSSKKDVSKSTNDSAADKTVTDKKKASHLPSFLLPLFIFLAIITLLVMLLVLQHRRLNQIRAMKRHRRR